MSFLSVSCLFRQGYRVHLMNLTMKVIQQQQQEQQMVVVTVIEVVLVVSYPALTMMRCLCLLLPSRYCAFPVKIIDFSSKLDFHSILPMTRPEISLLFVLIPLEIHIWQSSLEFQQLLHGIFH